MSRRPRPRPRRAKAAPPRGRRGGRRLWLIAPLVLIPLLIAGAAFLIAGPGPRAAAGDSTEVVLRRGEGLGGVARDLEQAGVVRSGLLFAVTAEVTGARSALQAGEYAFPSRASLLTVLHAIRTGAVARRLLTAPEGVTSAFVARLLLAQPFLIGPAPTPPEGALLPETYLVTAGETRVAVLRRMAAARDRLLASLWATRAPGLPFRNPAEAVILASIVEKETALPDERPRIAAVFINRLRQGMRLESDPTVVYGLTGGTPLGHGLRVSELAGVTPYNTYRIAGLPPTPIANPGRAALAATLRPAATKDLYFVADGSGGHAFSDTLAAHLRNVAHWRAIEQARAAPARPGATP